MAEMGHPWHSLVFDKRAKKKIRSYELPAPLAPIADTHAHLTCFWEKDPAEVLARAALAGVRQLTTLVDPVDTRIELPLYHEWLEGQLACARELLALLPDALACDESPATRLPVDDGPWGAPCALLDHVRFLVGVHPYGAPRYTDEVNAQVEALLADPLCAGVGEIGLDYHFDHDDDIAPAPHGEQISCMERQLALAVARNVPVELHLRNDPADESREAHADAYRVLQSVGVPKAGCVLHCFGEDAATMERFVELGCYVAFGGATTFKRNEPVREAFAACPADRILFETDCPYMAPEPLRGSECEPAMIALTIDTLSRDRSSRTSEDPAAIQLSAWHNAVQLFGGVPEK